MLAIGKDAPKETPIVTNDKARARTGAPSIISADLSIKGTVISSGDVQVDGRMEGEIRAKSLVIGDKAEIDGDIYCEEVTIRGKVKGDVRAHKVQLCAGGHVNGTILHQTLSIEPGAIFDGNCRHSATPLEGADEPKRPASHAQIQHEVGAPRIPLPVASSMARPQTARSEAL